ncbi:hypothetical protein SISSUDRAFT_1050810, partial [Sistotremastrum suecicum HHB10207 ss-3]
MKSESWWLPFLHRQTNDSHRILRTRCMGTMRLCLSISVIYYAIDGVGSGLSISGWVHQPFSYVIIMGDHHRFTLSVSDDLNGALSL